MKKLLWIVVLLIVITGCGREKIDGEALYKTIEATVAQEFVKNDKAILIDVRTLEEYEEGHIEDAINMPFDTITKDSLKNVTNSKIDNIIVYCKSGARSKEAAIKMLELGYTNVYDLGSMSNWEGQNAQ